MKHYLGWFLGIGLMITIQASHAQTTLKLGHVNSQELLQLMPEFSGLEAKLKAKEQELQDTYTVMLTDYQKMIDEYQNNQATMSGLIRESKENDIADKERRIQEFQMGMEQDYLQYQQSLIEPLRNKIMDAIAEVGRENGYTYIFDTAIGSVLFYENGDDVTAKIKTKLGI